MNILRRVRLTHLLNAGDRPVDQDSFDVNISDRALWNWNEEMRSLSCFVGWVRGRSRFVQLESRNAIALLLW
jgi:hypothetical protein